MKDVGGDFTYKPKGAGIMFYNSLNIMIQDSLFANLKAYQGGAIYIS